MSENNGFKNTEIGIIPVDWEINEIQNISQKIWIGLVTTMTSHYVENGIPLIRNNNIKPNKIFSLNMIFLDVDFSERNKQRYLHTGDIVTVHTGDIGTSTIIEPEFDPSHGFATINTSVDETIINNKYLCYYFNSPIFKHRIEAYATGDGRRNFNLYDYLFIKVPYPQKIHEQRKIAHILSTVDAVIEKTEAAINKYKNIKAGMMRDLFTRGIDLATGKLRPSYKEAPELYKQSELGRIPKEWIYTYFSKIIKSTQLGTSMLGDEQQYGIPLLKMGNLTLSGFSFNKLERLNTNDKEKIADFLVKSEDFLFNTRNTLDLVGKSCVWKNELPYATFNSNIMRIKFTDSIDNYFMGYFFENSVGWKEFKRIAMGTTSVAAIYNRDFENCRIIIPKNYDEQVSISKKLLSIDKITNKENGNLNKLNNIKQALMSDLLTGKVRVKYEEEKEEAL